MTLSRKSPQLTTLVCFSFQVCCVLSVPPTWIVWPISLEIALSAMRVRHRAGILGVSGQTDRADRRKTHPPKGEEKITDPTQEKPPSHTRTPQFRFR